MGFNWTFKVLMVLFIVLFKSYYFAKARATVT